MKLEEYLEQNGELAHFGTKGMKWGVRKDRAEGHRETAARNGRIADGTATRKDKIDQAVLGKGMKGFGGGLSLNKNVAARLEVKYGKKADKAQAKADAKTRKAEAIQAHKDWKKDASGTEMANKVFQKASKDFQKTAELINNDPNYKDKDVTKGLVGRQYQATMSHYFNEHMAQASVDLTLNDQGRAYIYQFDVGTSMMRGVEHQMVLHDESGVPDYKVELDDLGHMISFSPVLNIKHGAFDEALMHLDNDELNEMAHFGVKGMHWGVRKSDPTSAGSVRRGLTKANVALDAGGKVVKAGEKNLIFLPKEHRQRAAVATQSRVLGEAAAVNQDARFNGKDIKHNPELKAAYHAEIEKRALKIYKEELDISRTNYTMDIIDSFMNPSGSSMSMRAPRNRIRHDSETEFETLLTLHFEKDELGQIIGVTADDLGHADTDFVEDFLSHYGVAGMKWGVRRSEGSSAPAGHPSDTAAISAPSSAAKVASEDHQKAMGALDKANKHGLSSLSTEEMRHLTNRLEAEKKFNALTNDQKSEMAKQVEAMRLEKEFKQLSSERAKASRSTGRKVVDALLGDVGKVISQEGSNYGKSLVKDMIGQKKADDKPKKAKGKSVNNLDDVLKPYSRG